jgi:hypothetical protein
LFPQPWESRSAMSLRCASPWGSKGNISDSVLIAHPP